MDPPGSAPGFFDAAPNPLGYEDEVDPDIECHYFIRNDEYWY